jgi:hypothetical protein
MNGMQMMMKSFGLPQIDPQQIGEILSKLQAAILKVDQFDRKLDDIQTMLSVIFDQMKGVHDGSGVDGITTGRSGSFDSAG